VITADRSPDGNPASLVSDLAGQAFEVSALLPTVKTAKLAVAESMQDRSSHHSQYGGFSRPGIDVGALEYWRLRLASGDFRRAVYIQTQIESRSATIWANKRSHPRTLNPDTHWPILATAGHRSAGYPKQIPPWPRSTATPFYYRPASIRQMCEASGSLHVATPS